MYYSSLRNGDAESIISSFASNSNTDYDSAKKAYNHLLINQYDLDGKVKNFDPDYDIALSLQRLRDGKNVEEHDIILIKHEALEHDLMRNGKLSYDEAHAIANKSFDYQAALFKWLSNK